MIEYSPYENCVRSFTTKLGREDFIENWTEQISERVPGVIIAKFGRKNILNGVSFFYNWRH
jgi:hypothetical protein